MLRIADGDTLTLRARGGAAFPVRLSDIDTPETHHATNTRRDDRNKDGTLRCPNAPKDAPGHPYGKAAGASLAELAPVGAEALAECYDVDQYRRHVCHLFIGGTNVNLQQLRRGAAMLPANEKFVRDPESRTAKAAAREAQRGVWAGANPMNPDHWRDECWCQGRCEGAEK